MTRTTRLVAVLLLNVALIGALVVVGFSAHSLGVLAAGADYLADAAAIAVSLIVIWLSKRPSTTSRPDGYPRATTYAALLNASWLFVLSVFVMGGAADRLLRGSRKVDGLPVLVVSAIAAAVMLVGALILRGEIDDDDDHGADLNLRAVLLDTVADATAAAGVATAGAVIFLRGGLYWLDPLVALIIALVVAYHALRLTGEIAARLSLDPPCVLGDAGGAAGRGTGGEGGGSPPG